MIKSHRLSQYQTKEWFDTSKIICSIRNPCDAIASSLQRRSNNQAPSSASVKRQLEEFERFGIFDVVALHSNPNAMVLRYEDFYDNWDYLFSRIESFLQISISLGVRKRCMDELAIEVVEAKSRRLGGFSNYDKTDHIHGQHISQYRGQVGYGVDFLGREFSQQVYTRFQVVFEEFHYPTPFMATDA
ncbi:MAG: sulfotransferase domain-containing protein [Cyanobacteria bacterium J06638_7]